jgi:MOSC domain-containing protein YiiM
MIEVVGLFRSPGHNYVGHHGGPPGEHPIEALTEASCVAGQGIEGDRYFGHKPDYKGQITFFEMEVAESLAASLGVETPDPAVFRRNVVTRGVDLSTLIGRTFRLDGVEFEGVEECRPCYWMNRAFAEGAEERLKGRGGLRARIRSTGPLRLGPCALT